MVMGRSGCRKGAEGRRGRRLSLAGLDGWGEEIEEGFGGADAQVAWVMCGWGLCQLGPWLDRGGVADCAHECAASHDA
ncbi:MAG: hypothetical protein JWR15_4480 [Prosthecobacter sp.]|nr:hypothetical protein [Prosthecobacter sp.]